MVSGSSDSHFFSVGEVHMVHVVSTQAIALPCEEDTRAFSAHGAVVCSRESMSTRVFPTTIQFFQTVIHRVEPLTSSSQS
ncbi:MAG: hypothetical protein DI576_04905 [Actinomyces sp.]|nr:MAG: hypothetical protein DI576_04905 [Actinomyces sp.]